MLHKNIPQKNREILLLLILAFLLNISRSIAIDYGTAYDSAYDIYDILGDDTNRTGNLNITFQVRSCDDAACDSEIFVGPDNTSATYFENSTLTELNTTLTPNSRYFQYLAYLHTEDLNYTPMLFNVTVDYDLPPLVSLDNPADFANFSAALDFNYTATDTNLDTCELWGNWSGGWHLNESFVSPSSGSANGSSVIALEDGQYVWTVYCNDTLGNTNTSVQNYTLTVDLTAPVVGLDYPSDYYNETATGAVVFNFTANDTYSNIDTCELWGNWSGGWHLNETFVSPTSGIANSSSIMTIEGGLFVWSVYCNDTVGNYNNTVENRTLTVDTSPPAFEPIGDIAVNEDFATFDIILSDNLTDNVDPDSNLGISFSINNSNVTVTIDNATNNLTIASVGNATDTTNISLTVVDSLGNSNFTSFDLVITPVNDAPWWDPIDDIAVNEDFSTFDIILSANISDVEDADASLQVSFDINNSNVTLTLDNATNNLTITAIGNASDTANISLTLVDTNGATSFESFDLVITPQNDVPWWDTIGNTTYSMNEDESLANLSAQADFRDYFRDVENDRDPQGTNSVLDNESDISCAMLGSSPSAQITCTATNNFTGSFDLRISGQDISDGNTVSESVIVTVNAVNDAPWWNETANNTYSYTEDFGLSYIIWDEAGLNNTFFDVEDGNLPLNCTVSANDSNIVTNVTYESFDGDVRADSVANASGSFILTVNCSDTSWESTVTSFDVVVTAQNDAPWWNETSNSTYNYTMNFGADYTLWDEAGLNNTFRDVEDDNLPFNCTATANDSNVIQNVRYNGAIIADNVTNAVGRAIITVNCSDSGWLSDLTSFEVEILDDGAPMVLIVSPTATTYTTSSVSLDYVAVDASLDTVWYTTNSGATNTTLTQNITLSSLSNADYTLILYANDTSGNVNETSVTFTISVSSGSTTPPSSSGTSGSYSGSAPTDVTSVSNIVSLDVKSGEIAALNVASSAKFTFNNKEYIIDVKEMTTDSVRLWVLTGPIEVVVKKGKRTAVDLDKDGNDDIRIELREINQGFAFLYIKELPPPTKTTLPAQQEEPAKEEVEEQNISETAPVVQPVEGGQAQPQQSKIGFITDYLASGAEYWMDKAKNNRQIAAIATFLIAFLLIGLILFVVRRRKKRETVIINDEGAKDAKPEETIISEVGGNPEVRQRAKRADKKKQV